MLDMAASALRRGSKTEASQAEQLGDGLETPTRRKEGRVQKSGRSTIFEFFLGCGGSNGERHADA
jgi:hypothetical protein